MVICSSDALKKSSKKKEAEIERELIEVLQQPNNHRKKTGKWKIGIMKPLALTLSFLVRLTLTAFAFIHFKKSILRRELT